MALTTNSLPTTFLRGSRLSRARVIELVSMVRTCYGGVMAFAWFFWFVEYSGIFCGQPLFVSACFFNITEVFFFAHNQALDDVQVRTRVPGSDTAPLGAPQHRYGRFLSLLPALSGLSSLQNNRLSFVGILPVRLS